MIINGILTTEDFIASIDVMVREKNVGYFDAVLLYCEQNNIEVETAAALVKSNSVLKSRIQMEAENINMMKRSARLPI